MKDGRDYPHDILTHILSTYQDQDSITEYNISHMIDEFATFFVAGLIVHSLCFLKLCCFVLIYYYY